jgi:hypothetical protein
VPRGKAAVGALSGTVRRPGGTSLVLAALAGLICAFYFWTAYTSGPGSGYYDLLTDGFLDGNAYLPVEPSHELLALPDPYDPAQNAPYRLHDASLYQGRYYLYFGPTPVFLLHLPLRAVGVRPSDALATSVFASAGFLFAMALMLFLVRRYRPATGLPTRIAATLLLGLANVAPFLLRRPSVYEVAITAGYLCLMAGLYLTLTGVLRERPSLVRVAGGSLALGLAVGARPHLILALPVWIWAWARLWGVRERGRRGAVRLAVAALAPLGVCVALLGIYNLVRFGSLTEFGSSYQLAGINAHTLDRFSLDRLVPGVFFYLLAPPQLDTVFPFAHLFPHYPGTLSPEYAGSIEAVSGALATTPMLALALAAPVLLLVRRRFAREQTVLACMLLLSGLLVLVAPILTFDGATMRYEADFVSLLLLSALLVGLRLQDELRGALVRRVAAAVAVCATTVAVLFALAFSMTGYTNALQNWHPDQYRALEQVFTLGTAPDDTPG